MIEEHRHEDFTLLHPYHINNYIVTTQLVGFQPTIDNPEFLGTYTKHPNCTSFHLYYYCQLENLKTINFVDQYTMHCCVDTAFDTNNVHIEYCIAMHLCITGSYL